jgi:hypothetical protein
MRNIPGSVTKTLVSVAGLLAVVIIFRVAGDGVKQPAAIPPPVPAASSPNTAAPSPVSTPAVGRIITPEPPDNRVEDFAMAIEAAVQNGEKLNDDRDVFALGYRWVAVDPEAALDFVLKMPADNTLLLVALVDEWTRRDPSSAAQWATQLPEGAQRAKVLPSMVAVWAESAPTNALRFATGLPAGEVRNDAVISAVSGWARQDPPAALDWARQSLQGVQQDQAYTQAVFAWSQRDAVAAAEWLRSMPDGRTWDSAASVLSGALVDRHPALALSLAGNIADPDLRSQRIENVAQRWLAADRAAAEEALIHSDLSAAAVSRLIR